MKIEIEVTPELTALLKKRREMLVAPFSDSWPGDIAHVDRMIIGELISNKLEHQILNPELYA